VLERNAAPRRTMTLDMAPKEPSDRADDDADEDEDEQRVPQPPDRLTPRVLAVCQAVGDFIEAWGFRSIHGRIWTFLALTNRPVAQAEIAEVLGVSRSLVSLGISELQQYGLVRSTGTHRNAPYVASMDVWPVITDVLRSREWMLIEKARVALEALILEAEFAERAAQSTIYDKQRMRLLLTMTELAQAGLRAIMALHVPQSFDAFGDWLKRASTFFKHMGRLPPFRGSSSR
jgi:DNA-binding transcriptional regulator GbsR (MarR family)